MPAPLPAVLIALDLADARATRKQLEDYQREPRRIQKVWTLAAHNENRSVGVPFDYHLPAGSTAYVSLGIQRTIGAERFLALVQRETNGLKVRNLDREGFWPGWDAEPEPPAEPDVDQVHDELREIAEAGAPSADVATWSPEQDAPRRDVIEQGEDPERPNGPIPEQEPAQSVVPDLTHQEPELEDGVSADGSVYDPDVAWQDRIHATGCPLDRDHAGPCPPADPDEGEKEEGPGDGSLVDGAPADDVAYLEDAETWGEIPEEIAGLHASAGHNQPLTPEALALHRIDRLIGNRVHLGPRTLGRLRKLVLDASNDWHDRQRKIEAHEQDAIEAEETRAVGTAGPSPSEVVTWIYVAGSGWWDGPWLLQDGVAQDDVGTKVLLEHVRATSTLSFEQRRQLPGSLR